MTDAEGTAMKKDAQTRWLLRAGQYIIGLLILALGVAVSANSGLGISPVNALPYVLSEVVRWDPGLCVIAVFSTCILLQIIILRREFKSINLLQIAFSTVFGGFVSVTKFLIGDFTIPTYPGKLLMLAVSIVLIALGISVYIGADIVPMPMEGLTIVIADKWGKSFHGTKAVLDTAVVLLALCISLAFLGRVAYIREGTVITALAAGKVMALIKKLPWLHTGEGG